MSRAGEEWRDIPGYGGWYQISRWGEVRSYRRKGKPGNHSFKKPLGTPKIMTPFLRKGMSMCVKLTDSNGLSREKYIARLMAITWIGPIPDGAVVWLKDGDITNLALSNIMVTDAREWVKTAKRARGFRGSRVKWPVLKIDTSLEIVDAYRSARQAAKENYLSYQTILDYCNLEIKRTVISPDGFIYAWDDERWLRRLLKRAMPELDEKGIRYTDPYTEEYWNLPIDAEPESGCTTLPWADALPIARGVFGHLMKIGA